jgi:hypothetical protein
MPRQIEDAKAELKALPKRVRKAFHTVVNNRGTLALFVMLAIAFGAQAALAPTRLPPLGGWSLAAVGLPPLDLGEAGRIAGDAGQAAARQGGGDRLKEALDARPELKPVINGVGFGASLVIALLLAVYQSRQPYHLRREGLAKA